MISSHTHTTMCIQRSLASLPVSSTLFSRFLSSQPLLGKKKPRFLKKKVMWLISYIKSHLIIS